MLEAIREGIRSLSEMPERFAVYENENGRHRDFRRMIVKKYLVLYQVENANHLVTVVRVLYGGMDIDAALEQSGI